MQIMNLIKVSLAIAIATASSSVLCANPADETAYNNFLSCIKGDGKSCITPDKIYSNETVFTQQHKHLSQCLSTNLISCKRWVSGQSQKENELIKTSKEYVAKAKRANIDVLGIMITTLKTKLTHSAEIFEIHDRNSASSNGQQTVRRKDNRSIFQKIKDGILEIILLPIEIPLVILIHHLFSNNNHCYFDDAGSHCSRVCWNAC